MKQKIKDTLWITLPILWVVSELAMFTKLF